MTANAASSPKHASYYENARSDVVAELPRPLGAALDVGCGVGNVGRGLRDAGATRVVGIEVVEAQADRARAVLDRVVAAPVETGLDELHDERFDTILCLDVLEHLVDPAAVLRRLRDVAAPDARLQVSVPNARHLSLVWDLVVRGSFNYAEHGHRDSTHLRWFTRRDIVVAIEAAGWRVERVTHPALGRTRLLDRLTRGRSTEFTVGQWYVLARLAGAAPAAR
jgi:2-polyprenyl-3-methyl-5-hydroxy-6-metoxy-1,4-benzoquinol methylase